MIISTVEVGSFHAFAAEPTAVESEEPESEKQIENLEFFDRWNNFNKCNVSHCHPHRFRRTCATTALPKGMPIEQVQKMLGHEEINTTLTYISITDSTVKNSHRKYMG